MYIITEVQISGCSVTIIFYRNVKDVIRTLLSGKGLIIC